MIHSLQYKCTNTAFAASKQMRRQSEFVKLSCITKTKSICMVVLMLHQHKTQYKPSKYSIITASPGVCTTTLIWQTSSTPINSRHMQDNGFEYVPGHDEMWLAVSKHTAMCILMTLSLTLKKNYPVANEEVKTFFFKGKQKGLGEDMMGSCGKWAEERKWQRRAGNRSYLHEVGRVAGWG